MITVNELRKDIAKKEMTKNPIFLLQYKHTHCGCENYSFHEENNEECKEPLEVLHTESVFFTREAAETFAKQTVYKYPEGWQVSCISCSDELDEILNNHDFFARLLKVIEGITGMDFDETTTKEMDKLYQIAHLVETECIKNHPKWLEEFEQTERALKEANII